MSESPIFLNGVALPLPRPDRPRATWTNLVIGALASPSDWLRKRRDIRLLLAMDDRLLHDIGIVRSEIFEVVRKGRDGND